MLRIATPCSAAIVSKTMCSVANVPPWLYLIIIWQTVTRANRSRHSSLFVRNSNALLSQGVTPPPPPLCPGRHGRGSWERGPEADPQWTQTTLSDCWPNINPVFYSATMSKCLSSTAYKILFSQVYTCIVKLKLLHEVSLTCKGFGM